MKKPLRPQSSAKQKLGRKAKVPAFERVYAKALTSLANEIDRTIRGWNGESPAKLAEKLESFADIIEPWARKAAARMVWSAALEDVPAWLSISGLISGELRKTLTSTPTGEAYNALLDSQVELIQSIPRAAAERVHVVVREAQLTGTRAENTAKIIQQMQLKNGLEVNRAKAMLIARTESSRAASTITEIRAKSVGSKGYIWRTSRDVDVRKSHKALDGEFIRWDSPPVTDKLKGHAGCVPNCRCYPEPVLRDV